MDKRVKELMREGRSYKEAKDIAMQEKVNEMTNERIGKFEERLEELEEKVKDHGKRIKELEEGDE